MPIAREVANSSLDHTGLHKEQSLVVPLILKIVSRWEAVVRWFEISHWRLCIPSRDH